MARKSTVKRKTKETDITVEFNLDGRGEEDVNTPIPFLSHMLSNFARHGLFDLKVRAVGDTEVDLHHTVEDVGLVIGTALKKALKDNKGITRCGSASVPMMDALSSVVVDISNRPYLKLNTTAGSRGVARKIVAAVSKKGGMTRAFDMDLVEEFLKAFSNSAGLDLHVTLEYGNDIHHSIESVFKALGRALSAAVTRDKRIQGVLSTKGKL